MVYCEKKAGGMDHASKRSGNAEGVCLPCGRQLSVFGCVHGDTGGKALCVPLSVVRDGDTLYFHCAAEGQKTDCLRANPEVCVACVGDARCPNDRFTTLYESAVAKGTAREVTETEEKIHALRLICERFSPDNMPQFDGAIAYSLPVTAIWRIDVKEWTGKAKQ